MPQGSHIRETALPNERPVLTLNTTPDELVTSPLSNDFAGHSFDPPVPRLPGSSEKSKRRSKPQTPSSGLRRQSAQIYSPESPSRRGRRQSVDVTSPQIPETSYTPPTSSPRNQDRHGKRRQSAPIDAAPYSPFYHEQDLRRVGYQVENMHSDIAQPSHSGTPFAVKYPTVMPSSRELPRATPGLPQLPTSTQPSYDPYSAVVGAASQINYTPPREENRRTRRPQSGERSSRSKDYMTPTTRQ